MILATALACGADDLVLNDSPARTEDAKDAGPPTTTISDASVDAGPRETWHVLFIGNSYTFVNDVPGLLSRIAETSPAGPRITTESIVQGGWTLDNHLTDGIAQPRILSKAFTHVVLQGQSLEPTTPKYFLPAAKTFSDLITAAGSKPTWFVTWARAPEDTAYVSEYTSPDELQDRLTSAYDDAARAAPGSLLACVGEAFRSSLATHPEIRLHQGDGSHATLAGSYLAASTFYVAMTGSAVPDSSETPPGLDATQAAALRTAANIGANCTDAHIKAAVHFDASPYDFGTAGTSRSLTLYLTNKGAVPATLADGHTLTAPFDWTEGHFPSGTCTSTLAPGETCKVSVTFDGKTTGTSSVTVLTSDAYHTNVSRSLTGATTTRALLTLSEWADDECLRCNPLYLSGSSTFTFVVTNRGAQATTSIASGDTLASPLSWNGGSFPGGSGNGEPSLPPSVTLPFCGQVLAPGAQCLARIHVDGPDAGGGGGGQLPASPDAAPPQDRVVSIRYSDADGAIATFATRAVQVP